MLSLRSLDAQTGEATFGLPGRFRHDSCTESVTVTRVVRFTDASAAAHATDSWSCEACEHNLTVSATYPTFAAALGDPPPGSTITAEAMAAELVADVAELRLLS